VLGEWVLELKVQAQEQLQKPFLQLCSPEGCILDPNKKCDSYDDLQENATITAIAQQPKVAATNCAFSLWCTGGSRVLSWGHHKSGGDAAGVMQSLINVVDMKATEHAFAAILGSGKVVTWGDAESGGDSSMVQDRLQHVQKVFATDRAFAAVLKDGGVVTWGCALHGGDSATVQRLLTGVQHIVCTESAFAAITADEKVITWGNPECGGDSGTLQLHHVKHVQSTKAAFAALLGDGTIVAWGFSIYGGNTEPIAHVKTILSTKCAFAVALPFGHVKIWGCDGNDVWPATRNCVAASTKLRNIIDIFSTRNAIAALQKDGLSCHGEMNHRNKEIKGAVKLTGNSNPWLLSLKLGAAQEVAEIAATSKNSSVRFKTSSAQTMLLLQSVRVERLLLGATMPAAATAARCRTSFRRTSNHCMQRAGLSLPSARTGALSLGDMRHTVEIPWMCVTSFGTCDVASGRNLFGSPRQSIHMSADLDIV
jgi:hypothetical protein